MDVYNLLCVKYKKMQNSFYKEINYNNVDIFSVDLFKNKEILFLNNFIAKIYVDFILHTKNIKLIKKNEKLLYRRLFWADVLENKLLNLENSIRRKKGKPEKSLVKGYNNKDKDH
jgi:hypothetical protein